MPSWCNELAASDGVRTQSFVMCCCGQREALLFQCSGVSELLSKLPFSHVLQAWKKIEETRKRAAEIMELRKQNEHKMSAKDAAHLSACMNALGPPGP